MAAPEVALADHRWGDPFQGSWIRLSLRPILLYFASRLGFTLIALATATVTRVPLFTALTVWDSKWYLSIAQWGYPHRFPAGSGDAVQTNLGFFPLLPIVIRGVHVLPGLTYTDAGLLADLGIGLGAAVAVWWLVKDLWGTSAADRATALVFFSPGALVLSFVYTEGLTVMLVALVLLALRHERWVLAGAVAAVTTTADPVAVVAVVPCLVAAFFAIRDRADWRSLAAPMLAPLGVIGFFSYLWVHTGSFFEWFHAQRAGWQNGAIGGSVPRAVASLYRHGFLNPNDWVKSFSVVLAIALVVGFLAARPPAPWTGYVVGVMVFGVLSPIVAVTPRLLLRCFPLVAVLGVKLPRLLFEVVLGLSALAAAALMVMATGAITWTP